MRRSDRYASSAGRLFTIFPSQNSPGAVFMPSSRRGLGAFGSARTVAWTSCLLSAMGRSSLGQRTHLAFLLAGLSDFAGSSSFRFSPASASSDSFFSSAFLAAAPLLLGFSASSSSAASFLVPLDSFFDAGPLDLGLSALVSSFFDLGFSADASSFFDLGLSAAAFFDAGLSPDEPFPRVFSGSWPYDSLSIHRRAWAQH